MSGTLFLTNVKRCLKMYRHSFVVLWFWLLHEHMNNFHSGWRLQSGSRCRPVTGRLLEVGVVDGVIDLSPSPLSWKSASSITVLEKTPEDYYELCSILLYKYDESSGHIKLLFHFTRSLYAKLKQICTSPFDPKGCDFLQTMRVHHRCHAFNFASSFDALSPHHDLFGLDIHPHSSELMLMNLHWNIQHYVQYSMFNLMELLKLYDSSVSEILSDFSSNLQPITSFLLPLLSILPYPSIRTLVDLIINILTFSPAGFSSCGQGHITGKWSVEQNGWQELRWTGQWVVECWRQGWGWKDSLNVKDEHGDEEERRWETQKSQDTPACCSLSRWPLSLFLGRRMCLPAIQSIMLTPTAEQHLFIRLDRWKRGLWRWDEVDEGASHVKHISCNYEELM